MIKVNLPTAELDYHVPFGGRKGFQLRPLRTRQLCPLIIYKIQDELCSIMTKYTQ